MRLDPRAWQSFALVLALIGIGWSICGFALDALPAAPSTQINEAADIDFQITRVCFFGPTMSLLVLAYLAVRASRLNRPVHWIELVVALIATASLVPLIGGLALIFGPVPPEERATENAMATLWCLLPALAMLGLAGVIWFWTRGRYHKQ